jgi:VanZ family protein
VRSFLKYWLPVLVLMAGITGMSTGLGQVSHSSRIIGPVLRWFVPDISPETERNVVFAIRKCAHVTEYAVLAALFWRALRKPVRGDGRPWSRRTAIQAILFAACFAATDEFHQSFHPTRQGQVADVVLDTVGACVGLALVRLVWGFRRDRIPATGSGN